jgi:hypothetical protein
MSRPGRIDHLPVSLSGLSSGLIQGSMVPFASADRIRIFRYLVTLLAAYCLVFGSWRLQDGPQEATALRF